MSYGARRRAWRRTAATSLLLAAWPSLGCTAAAATEDRRPAHGERSGPAPRCDLEPLADCGAGRLPRVEGKAWGDGEAKRLPELAAKGTVAAVWDGQRARLLVGCALDGRYTEVAGEPGSGRLWATNRVIFRTDEIPASCRAATHVVATFVAPRAAGKSAPAGSEPIAILVPLPCPPTADAAAAPGCVGRGLTGAQRLERASGLIAKVRESGTPRPSGVVPAEVAAGLEIFALAPDDYQGLLYAGRSDTADCALSDQTRWVGLQYLNTRGPSGTRRVSLVAEGNRSPPPRLDDGWADGQSCLTRPVFLQCFPGIFDPAPANAGCWYSTKTLP